MNRIYLDNAATSPLDEEVIETMVAAMREQYGNPSSAHAQGRKVKTMIEDARGKIAGLLKCQPSEIFFTSGGTEADNLALRGAIKSLNIKTLITSPIEHHAVLHTAEELAHSGEVKLYFVDIDNKGHVVLESLEKLMSENPGALVSLMHANNEIGNLLNIEKTAEIVRRHGGFFHSDTVQTMGHYAFDLNNDSIDFLAGAAHKFNGPKGVGFIYIRKRNRIQPEITGGAQEREMRGGTENVYGILGMAKALEICYKHLEEKRQHIQGLKTLMIEKLKEEIPGVQFNGDAEGESLYTVLSVSFPPSDSGNMLLFNLDLAGISASGGSACSSGSVGGSHVINTIYPGTKRTTIRFSFGKFNTKDDVLKAVETLKKWYPATAEAH
jgi:cysteine desulfurase